MIVVHVRKEYPMVPAPPPPPPWNFLTISGELHCFPVCGTGSTSTSTPTPTPTGFGKCAASPFRRVLVTHTNGKQTVQELVNDIRIRDEDTDLMLANLQACLLLCTFAWSETGIVQERAVSIVLTTPRPTETPLRHLLIVSWRTQKNTELFLIPF